MKDLTNNENHLEFTVTLNYPNKCHPSWEKHPLLLKEIDLDKNTELTYNNKRIHVLELSVGTNKKLDWKCSTCEHEWKAAGAQRSGQRKSGCNFCAGQVIHTDGRNSMAVTHPELAKEFQGDATKVMAGTDKRLDWKCSICEHQWKTRGYVRLKSGCPACVDQILHSDGRNSLSFKFPELAKEYQGDANKVISGTNKKLPWKCSICEHEWKASGTKRAYSGRGCPVCAKQALHSDGRNSMAMTHPQLAKEYQGDATKHTAGVRRKLNWKCSECEYVWISTGDNRVKGQGCPVCAQMGFQPHLPAYYYVNEIMNKMNDRLYFKGGISSDWKKRLNQISRGLPSDLSIRNIEVAYFETGQDARDLETKLLQISDIRAPKRDFEGGNELFMVNPLEYIRTSSDIQVLMQ